MNTKQLKPKFQRINELVRTEGRPESLAVRDDKTKRDRRRFEHGLRTRNVAEVLAIIEPGDQPDTMMEFYDDIYGPEER